MNLPRIYFAGRVSAGGGYRKHITDNERVMSYCDPICCYQGNEFIYSGPSALSCDHGCFHVPASHGLISSTGCTGWLEETGDNFREPFNAHQAVSRCLEQIRCSDAVHAYIDDFECFGTIAELGFASAIGIPIYLVIRDRLIKVEYDYRIGHNGFYGDTVNEVIDEIPDYYLYRSEGGLGLEPVIREALTKGRDWISPDQEVSITSHKHDELWFIKSLPTVVSVLYGGPGTIDKAIFKTHPTTSVDNIYGI